MAGRLWNFPDIHVKQVSMSGFLLIRSSYFIQESEPVRKFPFELHGILYPHGNLNLCGNLYRELTFEVDQRSTSMSGTFFFLKTLVIEDFSSFLIQEEQLSVNDERMCTNYL